MMHIKYAKIVLLQKYKANKMKIEQKINSFSAFYNVTFKLAEMSFEAAILASASIHSGLLRVQCASHAISIRITEEFTHF